MAEGEKKGVVTPLDSLFTSEEAEKAARRVQEAIADRQKELCQLRDFMSDNSALIHHVQKLPEELSHDIMVPFGGAAFFPGRLVHTNEFLVLLGEGYYAERSAKQTVEILERRGKSLEVHLESLNKIVKDLEVEAKFFDSTAAEVADGLVEIREEYVEETQSLSNTSFLSSSKAHNSGIPDEDEEDAKIMARLDELEREEEEAVSDLSDDEDDEAASSSDVDEVEDDENASYLKVDEGEDDEEENDDDENSSSLKASEDDEEENSEDYDIAENISETDVEVLASKATGTGIFFPTSMQRNAMGLLQQPSDQSSVSSSKMQIAPEGPLKSSVEQPRVIQQPSLPPETSHYLQKSPPNIQVLASKATGTGTFFPTSMQHNAMGLLQHPSDQSSVSSSKMQIAPEGPVKSSVEQPRVIQQQPSLPPETSHYLQKSPPKVQAFTGAVIERSYGLSPAKPSNDSTSGQPSRPVSRFKMQKGNR